MPQKPVPFVPRWVGPVQGHAINVARRFYPRLAAHHEFDDLLQESYIVFLRCKRRYGGKIDNAAWFMSLFRTALHNQFLRLISQLPGYNLIEDYGGHSIPEPVGELESSAYLLHLFTQLPIEIVQLFKDAALNTDERLRRKAMNKLRRWVDVGGLRDPLPRRIRLRTVTTKQGA